MERIRRVGSHLTLVVTLLALVSANAAYITGLHIHILPDGKVIVHSHPLEKNRTPGNQHRHSSIDLAVLTSSGKLLLTTEPATVDTTPLLSPVRAEHQTDSRVQIPRIRLDSPNKRSPPRLAVS